MKISYNWLRDYIPAASMPDPQQLSIILTSIGLEVESLEHYENIKGGLQGLVAGEVKTCELLANSDKLKLTTVDVGNNELLQIVCGATNVAAGQKVVVAKSGTTIHPIQGEPILIKAAKIRGTESNGMLCAEDEIGISNNHDGIIVLPSEKEIGKAVTDLYNIYTDWIYEIGLTPNRMDAMSHIGVAKDVCAYLSYHTGNDVKVVLPYTSSFKPDRNTAQIKVTVEDTVGCERYSGISIDNIEIKPSPVWMRNRLAAIGVKAHNNIVDITNYILHETGQPLHAFDADAITGNEVIVKMLPDKTIFTTLDDKQRQLSNEDLMICNSEEGMCIAGVYGGIKSGVTQQTKNIFLESAWFNPIYIRKTSVRHGLRTDAATRFEKGVDISNTVNVLQRAALLIKELSGGIISSDINDVYPQPQPKIQVTLKFDYLKKLSGKNYKQETAIALLENLGFTVSEKRADFVTLDVPYSKPDISLPADIVEEVIRIDGIDNIPFAGKFIINASPDLLGLKQSLKDKISQHLTGQGFFEIVTNSIVDGRFNKEVEKAGTVKLLNSLNANLDVMRASMLQSGLSVLSYNINRKKTDLLLFEFGKTYSRHENNFSEAEHLALYLTGNALADNWKKQKQPVDLYYAKGLAEFITRLSGLQITFDKEDSGQQSLKVLYKGRQPGLVQKVDRKMLNQFDINQDVYFLDINFSLWLELVQQQKTIYREVSKFPAVERDLALIVDNKSDYINIESTIKGQHISRLTDIKLFDVFENEKLGEHKKSIAVNLTFADEEKTLTDKEIDAMMDNIIKACKKELGAEVRS